MGLLFYDKPNYLPLLDFDHYWTYGDTIKGRKSGNNLVSLANKEGSKYKPKGIRE